MERPKVMPKIILAGNAVLIKGFNVKYDFEDRNRSRALELEAQGIPKRNLKIILALYILGRVF